MSLYRFVYYAAVVGGWAALLAWLVAEVLFFRQPWLERLLHSAVVAGFVQAVLTGALAGAALGAGLNLVSGMGNAQWQRQLRRTVPGIVVGGIGGAAGALVGQFLFRIGFPQAIGWAIMGLGIGAAEGVSERSPRKLCNGLLGGAIGGFVGGLLFSGIARPGADAPMRATGFVILGLSVGALIGLTHVVLKEAWLTVVEGFRPGRQLILSQAVTLLGRGDHLPLPLLGYPGRDLESEHLRITRQADGTYEAEDLHSRIGSYLNNRPLLGTVPVADGDLLRLGTNIIRFSHRHRRESPQTESVESTAAATAPMTAPPPPGSIGQAASPSGARPIPRGAVPWQRTPVRPPSSPSGPNPRIPPPPPPPPT